MSTDPQGSAGEAKDSPRRDISSEQPGSGQSQNLPPEQDSSGQNEKTEAIPPVAAPAAPPTGYSVTAPSELKVPRNKSKLIVGLAVALAALIGAGGGIAIYAVSSSHHHGNHRQPALEHRERPGAPGPGFGERRNALGIPSISFMGQALHGDFVTSDEQGGYVTRRLQTGEVTAISGTSITVGSKDNYSQTYALNDSTKKAENLKVGDTVTVIANVTGNNATANSVTTGGAPRRNELPHRN